MKENCELIYVISSHVGEVGGAAKATLLLCKALVESGRQVRLFVTSCPEASVIQQLRALGVRVDVPHVAKGCRWAWPSRILALQLWVQARKDSPTLIHGLSLTAEARFLLQLPPVAPIYLWESTEALPHIKFVDRLIARYLHKAAALLAPSHTIARNMRQTYGFRGPIGILPFWVENPPPRSLSVIGRKRRKNLAFVGRMDLDKGFSFLFEAFSQLQIVHPDSTLTVCGGGDSSVVRSLAANNPAIDVRGYINNEEYESVVEECDAMVLPSLHEGYPLSLLEACGRGKPIIASSVGSIPEVFSGRNCALLVPPANTTALASAFLQLFDEDETTYIARCADALKMFNALNSPEVVRERLTYIYSNALLTEES